MEETILTCSSDCTKYYAVSDTAGTCGYQWRNIPVTPNAHCMFNRTIDSQGRVITEEERRKGKSRVSEAN